MNKGRLDCSYFVAYKGTVLLTSKLNKETKFLRIVSHSKETWFSNDSVVLTRETRFSIANKEAVLLLTSKT